MAEKIRLDTKYDLKGDYVPSDSEDEYDPREKRLLARARQSRDSDDESEREVYGFSAEEESEDDDLAAGFADSDVEGQEASDDDLPDPKAWGQNKRRFYDTDYVDQDFGGFGKDEEVATLEEREAKALQRKLAEQLKDDDFSLEFFSSGKTAAEDGDESEVVIKSDLSQMSKRQKLQLLKKESPEFMGLIEDFREKLRIAKETLRPILKMAKERALPPCKAIEFVESYYETILNYCTNVSFYILLKTKKIPIQSHPVTKRLFQYRQILKQLEPVYSESIRTQLEGILNAVRNGEEIRSTLDSAKSSKKRTLKQKKLVTKKLKLLDATKKKESDDDLDESGQNEVQSSTTAPEDFDGDTEKRAITYQMAKNKGLTPKRKKEQRNPRVKHRNKYRKAKIRRKGAIRDVRTEVTRYDGELSGIKANVKKSIKIR